MTDAEYQATVDVVVGQAANGISADFVPDSRQAGFTVNEAQRVDPVLARQLADAAVQLAAAVRANAEPCAAPSTPAQCADGFIRSFGKKAYRRPLADLEVTQLLTVFQAGLDGGSYAEGIELAARAMLQSASFLYHTEIGQGGSTVQLTPYEVANAISYLVLGAPPSEKLVNKALAGELDTPQGRTELVQQGLLADGGGWSTGTPGQRVQRVIQEWLGTDKLAVTAKDSNIYPDYAKVKPQIGAETGLFLNAVVGAGGRLADLLSADWTVVDPDLGALYGATGLQGTQRISTPQRLGILNQASFLSVYAHAHETAPVLRGVAVMRRVACSAIADPVDLAMAIVPPAPDPKKTTRDRYAAHATSSCAGCHDRIDNFGFAFEGFDGMGKARQKDNEQPVNTSVAVTGTDFDGNFADSNALVKAMAKSPQVHECFARHMFRAFAGTSSPESQPSEDDFVTYWKATLTDPADSRVPDTIAAFVESPSFNFRRGGE